MPAFLPGYNVIYLSFTPAVGIDTIERIGTFQAPSVFSWSYKAPTDLQLWCKRRDVKLTYVEDGFIRSFGLGAERSAPLSLVFDERAMHFDRLRPSRLEELLQSYDFHGDVDLSSLTQRLKRLMLDRGLSKYNFPEAKRKVADVAIAGRRRVLVLGQVEDDLSIRYGSDRPISGNELVMLAADENPRAQIFYRPHPESLSFAKPHYSNPRLVSDVCTILGPDFAIGDCLDSCDIVYTVTSLAGFEAAIRGKQVVTLGAPFYSGWSFTEDRLPLARRARSLTADQVLGAAYLLYPRYSGLPENSEPGEVLAMLERFAGAT
jgi:capsular polysaccharide export protein